MSPRSERQIGASDEAGTEVETAINTARNELVTGQTVLGYHHLTVCALGRSIREMEKCVQAATQELQNFGTIVVREDMNAEPAFWAQMPGNFAYIARRSLISSRNFVGFASLHNFAVGKAEGNRWGPAISILETTSQTPYYFNFHRRQVGNFTVTGPTGSGKTVGLGFLLCQAMRVTPQPRVAFFDKDRGADIFIRAMGGRYEVLVPGVPTGFNPLQLPGSPEDRKFLEDLLKFMVRPRDGSDLGAHQLKIIEGAIDQIFAVPAKDRRFAEVAHLLRGSEKLGQEDLASRFDVWTKTRGWLFNNERDSWSAVEWRIRLRHDQGSGRRRHQNRRAGLHLSPDRRDDGWQADDAVHRRRLENSDRRQVFWLPQRQAENNPQAQRDRRLRHAISKGHRGLAHGAHAA